MGIGLLGGHFMGFYGGNIRFQALQNIEQQDTKHERAKAT